MTARYLVGDVYAGLATLDDNSVDLVFSSPPFLALRSYLPADDPQKHLEIGSEATPADFLDTLLDVVEACDRVLAPHGSLCFELGDTFSGSFGSGDQRTHDATGGRSLVQRGGFQPIYRDLANGWPLDKSLCGIPTLFAWSLAYGRNLLRPERETPRWRIRNLVVWARPNPPVGALGDKYRPATSYVTVATKSRSRYFDLDAVRQPPSYDDPQAGKPRSGAYHQNAEETGYPTWRGTTGDALRVNNPAGAPPLDYWVLPTAPYAGSHYATFPPDLVVRPVKSMCPQRVCRVCGEPSRRITEPTEEYAALGGTWNSIEGRNAKPGDHGAPAELRSGGRGGLTAQNTTLGWTDCGHDDWRTGVVLDPFAGSGTTLSVATGHGRDAIGIDIDARNADLALDRVGPLLLTVETLEAAPQPT